MTGTEALSFSGQDHSPYRCIFGDGLQFGLEGGDHLAGKRVESSPTIESEHSNAIRVCSQDERLLRGQRVNVHNTNLPLSGDCFG
jgi:hypothetical protein